MRTGRLPAPCESLKSPSDAPTAPNGPEKEAALLFEELILFRPYQLFPDSLSTVGFLSFYWPFLLCLQTQIGHLDFEKIFTRLSCTTPATALDRHFSLLPITDDLPEMRNNACCPALLLFHGLLPYRFMEATHKPPSSPCPKLWGKFKSLLIFSICFAWNNECIQTCLLLTKSFIRLILTPHSFLRFIIKSLVSCIYSNFL